MEATTAAAAAAAAAANQRPNRAATQPLGAGAVAGGATATEKKRARENEETMFSSQRKKQLNELQRALETGPVTLGIKNTKLSDYREVLRFLAVDDSDWPSAITKLSSAGVKNINDLMTVARRVQLGYPDTDSVLRGAGFSGPFLDNLRAFAALPGVQAATAHIPPPPPPSAGTPSFARSTHIPMD